MWLREEERDALVDTRALLRRAGDIVHAVTYPVGADRSPLAPSLAAELFGVLAAITEAEIHLARALMVEEPGT